MPGRALPSADAVSIRSPEPSKTSVLGSSEDGIEPVSPPEGLTEPGHPRSTAYPLLYRDGEPGEPRYPGHKPCPEAAVPVLCIPGPQPSTAAAVSPFTAQQAEKPSWDSVAAP